MMVLRRECCIEKGQRDFLVLDFGEEVFFGLRVWFDFEEKKTWEGIRQKFEGTGSRIVQKGRR